MAFGIGFGAFAQGLTGGLQQGLSLGKQFKANRQDRAKQKAFDDARADYDSQIQENIMQQAGQADPNQPFDPKAAEANARKSVGSFVDNFYTQYMPNIIDTMVQQGDLEGAETMRKWAADGKERKFMESFGRTLSAWSAGQSNGDYEPFAKSAVKLLNDGGYDGLKATGYEILKDGDGNATGLTFTLDRDGEKFQHTFNSIDEAVQFLAGEGSPTKRAQMWESQQKAAQDLRVKRVESAIGLGRDIELENVKQQGRLDLQSQKHDQTLQLEASKSQGGGKAAAEDEYVLGLLRQHGFDNEAERQYLNNKYLGENYRKGKRPEEFRQQVVTEMLRDPVTSRLGEEEFRKRVDAIVSIAEMIDEGKSGNQPRRQAPIGLGTANTPLLY